MTFSGPTFASTRYPELVELISTRQSYSTPGFHDPDPIDLTNRPSWQTHAACFGMLSLFIPEGRGHNTDKVAKAKAICAGCPVKAPCLKWALDNNERYGVLGETTPQERRVLRAAMRAVA